MSKKTIDVEKIREAIETLKEAREVLGEIEEILPKDKPVRYVPWYPYVYPYQEPRWTYWRDSSPTSYDGTTAATVYN